MDDSRVFLMENHSTALAYWQCRDAQVIHLDAHPDLGFIDAARIAGWSNIQGRNLLDGESDAITYTKAGCFDLTNFLGAALCLKKVRNIIWVVPDWVWQVWFRHGSVIDAVRRFLPKVTSGIAVTDALNMQLRNGSLHVPLHHDASLTVCTLSQVSDILREGATILDIDLDFLCNFQSSKLGEIWITPVELSDVIKSWQREFLYTTIACSVHGGYTPVPCKELGAEIFRCFTGRVHAPLHFPVMQYEPQEMEDRYPAAGFSTRSFYYPYVEGLCRLNRLDPKSALPLLQFAAGEAADVAGCHYAYARALHMLKLYDEAEVAYRRALEIQPGMFEIYKHLAMLLSASRHRVDEAIQLFEQACALNPSDSGTLVRLGWLYETNGQRERAKETLEHALNLNPIDPNACSKLGSMLLQEDPQRAQHLMETAACFSNATYMNPVSLEQAARRVPPTAIGSIPSS